MFFEPDRILVRAAGSYSKWVPAAGRYAQTASRTVAVLELGMAKPVPAFFDDRRREAVFYRIQ